MWRGIIEVMPVAGAWLGLIGWIVSRFVTNAGRAGITLLILTALCFAAISVAKVWGSANPFGNVIASHLFWAPCFIGAALVFVVLLFGFAGKANDFAKVRRLAEVASVCLAVLGVTVDTIERANVSPWTQIEVQLAKERLFR